MRALILAPFSADELQRLRRRIDVSYESWLDSNTIHDPEELGARLQREKIVVLVVEADFVFEEVFDAAPCLRLVGVCRNALNQVDIESATAHGVAVTHAPGRNTNAVVEMTLCFMLALARRIPAAHQLVSGGAWTDPSMGYRMLRGREMSGSTVGVVGFGQIGREVARSCVALGAQVLAHDPLVPARQIEVLGARVASLAEVAERSDFVTLHVPDVDSTRGIVDGSFLALMDPGAYLINTSGGNVIDTAALVAALESGRIAGAALDVFEGHPLPQSHPLMSAPNVLLTPHIGGATAETVERHSRIMAGEIERLLDDQPLLHVVNPDYKLARAR